MKVSTLVVKTLREVPSGAEIPSHIFLARGGYIKQISAGLFSLMPMGKRVINKICKILHEEMQAIGGQEMDLPLINPAKLWKESGRYEVIGDELLRFKDRTQQDMVLAMTHEEAVTDLARNVMVSYKQLPFMLYHIKEKYRDEPRARAGLIRVKEFQMKDAYSFHADDKDLDDYYQKAYKAYERIFKRVGITPIIVESDLGIMGGKQAHEFMLETPSGEDCLILSEDGSYKANQDVALFDRESQKEEALPLEKVATPDKKTIEEVAEFLKLTPKQTMKAVMYFQDSNFILVLLRGDLDVSEMKLKSYLKSGNLLPADEEGIKNFGLVAGYAGPCNLEESEKLKILVDVSISEGSNFVTGANEEGFHYTNCNFGRDFNSENVGDFAMAQTGHKALGLGSRLKATRGIEIGNIFKLGKKFSESMKAEFLDSKGKANHFVMGCYGIGVGRLMAAVAEEHHDKFGPIWPQEIAPFQIHLLNIGADKEVVEATEKLYQDLQAEGYEVLFDDRDERPGVKFKDADLWGIPLRLAISGKTLAENSCEWKLRANKDFELVPLADLSSKISNFYTAFRK